MNFLAHFFLSQETQDALVGALLGDFVRGDPAAQLPASIAAGVRRHRLLDVYTDQHALARRSRQRLDPRFRLVRPVLVDIFYDHFLARRWSDFSSEPLDQFARRVHAALVARRTLLPDRIAGWAGRVSTVDWLTAYRDPASVERALRRAAMRMCRPTALAEGGTELQRCRDGLEQDFLEFFPDAVAHAARLRDAR